MIKQFDTRSSIALALVVAMIAMSFVLAFRPAVPDSDIFKVLIGGLMTVGFSSIISFYFGSSTGSKDKDDTLNQIAVATAIPNGNGHAPVPPMPTAWWGKMTDAEKNAVSVAKATDPRVDSIISAATSGTATADDLAYLVSKGLLTQDRATAIQAA